MAYTVKARYYVDPDQFGESFVLTSDNGEKDIKAEVGRKVRIVRLCSCGEDAIIDNIFCKRCREEFIMH